MGDQRLFTYPKERSITMSQPSGLATFPVPLLLVPWPEDSSGRRLILLRLPIVRSGRSNGDTFDVIEVANRCRCRRRSSGGGRELVYNEYSSDHIYEIEVHLARCFGCGYQHDLDTGQMLPFGTNDRRDCSSTGQHLDYPVLKEMHLITSA